MITTDQINLKPHRIKLLIEVLFVLLLCCLPLFYKLDALVIRQWDEARNAVSALEMLQNKNYVVRYFNGQPDYWDVKPPLLIWLQVLSIRIMGVNELAIRIPSAIASLLTMIFLIGYFHKYHNNRYTGYLASLILATSQGYINWHIARTGDHDALLILFITITVFLYYQFLTAPIVKNKLLVVITSALISGVFTKSIAMLIILPGLLIMTFIFKAHCRIFANKWFYFCAIIFMLICGSYYALRESMQPGYLKAVWNGELFPRYLNIHNAFNKESFWYYIKNIYNERFKYWVFIFLPAMLILPFCCSKEQRRLLAYLIITIITFLLIISAGTHNLWYDGPLYPLLSAVSALLLVYILEHLQRLFRNYSPIFRSLPILLLIMVFLYPGYRIMNNIKRTSEFFWDEQIYAMSYILRDMQHINKIKDEPFSIIFDGYYGHLLFYTRAIAYNTGKDIKIKPISAVQPNDLIIMSQENVSYQIKSKFISQTIYKNNLVELLKIKDRVP
jgi:4-amino-4-deoxy-L-arabinose transferase-like glycosyltransferase